MNIMATQYTLDNQSLEIYIAGCSGSPHCEGCHNPESWNFDIGEKYDYSYFIKIKNKIKDFDSLIKNIMIFGGEPLDQDIEELENFLSDLKSLSKPIWLFTRYDFDEIPNKIIDLVDYIKTGRYIKELKTFDNIHFGINLASNNQKIIKVKKLMIKLNPDKEVVNSIREKLKETGGYCPCVIETFWDEDTKCPCRNLKEKEECCCGLYVKKENDNA